MEDLDLSGRSTWPTGREGQTLELIAEGGEAAAHPDVNMSEKKAIVTSIHSCSAIKLLTKE